MNVAAVTYLIEWHHQNILWQPPEKNIFLPGTKRLPYLTLILTKILLEEEVSRNQITK